MLSLILWALIVYLLVQFTAKLKHNHKAHQFFKLRSPNLPVEPNPNILFGHAMKYIFAKRNWIEIDQAHKKYGKTFGAYYHDRPMVATCDLDFIKTFAIDETDRHTNRIILNIPFRELEQDGILFAEHDQWQKLRQAIAPAFSPHKIKSENVLGEIRGSINSMIQCFELKLDQAKRERDEEHIVVDIEDFSLRCTIDTIFACFFKQNGLVNFNSESDFYTNLVRAGLRKFISFPLIFGTVFPSTKSFIDKYLAPFHPQGQMRNEVLEFIKQQTKLHFGAKKQADERFEASKWDKERKDKNFENLSNFTLSDGTKFKRNMIDYVIDRFQDGTLTQSEFLSSTFSVYMAATKTTADSMAKVIHHLSLHPNIQTKLRNSILVDGVKSEYLSWTIRESMRLLPSSLIGCSRTLTHDVSTKSGLVPAGTFVYTSIYTINRMKEYWGEDALEFKPERWESTDNFHPAQYLAFGLGKRRCPGRDFAIQELKMVLESLLRNFKFERFDNEFDEENFESPLLIITVSDQTNRIKITRVESS